MSNQRREFLRYSAILGSGLLFSKLPLGASELFEAPKKHKYGVQLWTLRDIIAKDTWGILSKLGEAGYGFIESFEGPKGVYWGKSPKEFASFLRDKGLAMPSIHCNVFENFDKKVADAAEAGVRHVLCPWLGPQKTIDDFKKAADRFNEMGRICKKNGVRFGYHNHDYSFKTLDGEIPQQVMMDRTDADLVDFEMDIYWVVTAGSDPIDWFNLYPNRFRLAHVKDRSKTPVADNGQNSVVLGTGTIDYATILKAGREKGVKKWIVEQEANYGAGPLESCVASINYLKRT
ncbi:MAG: sugar phosphate isomerase/epimerase family protein [Bacteroidota bacterium]